jgi:hypothetical protein
MKRIVLAALLFIILVIAACFQDAKEDDSTQDVSEEVTTQNVNEEDTAPNVDDKVTKMDQILSKKGLMVKIIDYNETMLPLSFGHATSKIRKIISLNKIKYFLQIIKPSEYNSKIASIAYEDLIEVIEALQTLKQESTNDLLLKPEYLENTYISVDDYEIGYYVSKTKIHWFMRLSRFGTDTTLFLKGVKDIESLFNSSKNEIEKLMNDDTNY